MLQFNPAAEDQIMKFGNLKGKKQCTFSRNNDQNLILTQSVELLSYPEI